jgi:hypothetical protein
VLPGGFAQAVTTVTTTVVAAPITVAGTIATTDVMNNTVNNVTNVLPPTIPALPAVAGFGVAGAAAGTFDICVNLPGSQPSVPAGLVLTFARNGSLVCVTPALARILNPRAVSVTVPAGRKLIFAKRGGVLCIGKGPTSKRLTVPSTMSAGKVFSLATSGKLVCLKKR